MSRSYLVLVLGRVGTAAEFSWSWSADGVGCCVVVSWYLPGRCNEETKTSLKRHFEVNF